MSNLYRIFDTSICCNFALPELPESPDQVFSLTVSMGEGPANQFQEQGFEKAFEWFDYEGRVVCRCERRNDEYLYIFPQHATFQISSESVITCWLHKDASTQMMRHLLLNQIIPRFLASTGRLLLHASAVTLEKGKSVAFLGNSGFGKSTLASSFHRNGAELINDDCILLECGEDGVTAVGGLVGIRLFPDSVNAVFDECAGFTNYTPYTDKQQLILKNESSICKPRPRVLDAMFLLNDPSQEVADEAVHIAMVSGAGAMMAMIQSAFSLDPSERSTIRRNFNNIGQTISENLPVYSLQYPRVHARLHEVRAAVIRYLDARPSGDQL